MRIETTIENKTINTQHLYIRQIWNFYKYTMSEEAKLAYGTYKATNTKRQTGGNFKLKKVKIMKRNGP